MLASDQWNNTRITCNGCGGTVKVGEAPNTKEKAEAIRKEGWRLVLGIGWTCSHCRRCLDSFDVFIDGGTVETIHS